MLLRLGLPRDSALAITDNDGEMPWSLEDHLIADLWLITAQANSSKGKAPKDHPAREKRRSKATAAKGRARRAVYEQKAAANKRRIAGRTT